MNELRHIVITGGTGYIGHRLVEHALARGLYVTMLGRSPVVQKAALRVRWRKWSLKDAITDDAFDEGGEFPPVDAVIHLAHQWDNQAPESEDENLVALDRLLVASRRRGVRRFVFCSSVSTRQGALNRYGRVKWRNEQKLKAPSEIAARIGFVYGGTQRGQWGTLLRIVQKLPALPMVAADRKVQPIHVDDLCQALLQLIAVDKPPHKIVGLADPEPVAFGEFLKMLARDVFGKSLMVVPVSVGLALVASKVLKTTGLLPPGSEERILGLAGLPTVESRDDLRALGIQLRPLSEGLAGILRRRRVALEGHVLLRYLTGGRPATSILRRYVRGIERFHGGRPLKIPAFVRQWPALVGIYEPLGADHGAGNDLPGRLHVAVALADAMVLGRAGAYDYVGEGWVKAVINIFWQSIVEAILLPLRAIFGGRIR